MCSFCYVLQGTSFMQIIFVEERFVAIKVAIIPAFIEFAVVVMLLAGIVIEARIGNVKCLAPRF
jgi:hypothetical protein